MPSKIFIYDSAKAHSQMLIKMYKDKFEIIKCTNPNRFSIKDLSGINIAFVFINDHDDILKLLFINSKVEHVFLASNIRNIDYSLYKLNGVIFLNLMETKINLIKHINLRFKELGVLEEEEYDLF